MCESIRNGDGSDILGQVFTIGTRKQTANASAPALEIYESMNDDPFLDELFVLNTDRKVIGILTRQHVLKRFSGRYGFNICLRKNASQIMEDTFLSVDAATSIESAAQLAMSRDNLHVYDAIAVTTDDIYLCTVTVKDLLMSTIQIKLKHASDSNPLTGLPGNRQIQELINDLYCKTAPWSLVYFDLDNFKAYNDAYGFGNGDLMIKSFADILRARISDTVFCGHVGGDDFVLITNQYHYQAECERICHEFSQAIKPLYSSEDLERGYIISLNRAGRTENFPLASLSIAIVSNEHFHPDTLDELYHIVAKTKKKCKLTVGNSIVTV